jgi:hypothetical protein
LRGAPVMPGLPRLKSVAGSNTWMAGTSVQPGTSSPAMTNNPERPLFSVPALRFFIARPTLADAFFEYFRAIKILPVAGK